MDQPADPSPDHPGSRRTRVGRPLVRRTATIAFVTLLASALALGAAAEAIARPRASSASTSGGQGGTASGATTRASTLRVAEIADARTVAPTPGPDLSWLNGWVDPIDAAIADEAPAPAVDQAAWLLADASVFSVPSTSGEVEIVLPKGFPITVQAQQGDDPEWVAIRPDITSDQPIGWLPAQVIGWLPPATSVGAGIGLLDPALAAWLGQWGEQVGVQVVDLSTGISYGENADVPFVTASSVKVAMMLTLLRQLEASGRHPSSDQVQLLTAMIEESDNDAAEAINAEIGDRAGLAAFAADLGLDGFKPGSVDDQGWGWGTLTPSAMATLLTLFEQGKVLNDADDTALARQLMANVDSDQRTGVGTTAPDGATVLLKNGWVPGPDGLWVFNSSGIVEVDGRTYVIAVYTAHDASLLQGEAIVEHVCSAVAARLG